MWRARPPGSPKAANGPESERDRPVTCEMRPARVRQGHVGHGAPRGREGLSGSSAMGVQE